MGPGPMMGPPPDDGVNEKNKPQKPKNIKEVPGYLKKLLGGFFSRLLYIFILVWETKPWICFFMFATSVISGIMPVIATVISGKLINELTVAWDTAQTNPTKTLASGVVTILIIQAVYQLVSSLITHISNIVTSIAGELVVNHVNVKIMKKAKEIDLCDYDNPDFYEKLENASREAGHRPIQILSSSFNIVSKLITVISFIVMLWAVTPIAPLAMIAVALPSAVITFIFRKKNFNYMRHRSKDRRQLSYYSSLMTNKDIVKEVKIFGLGNTFISRYREVFDKYFKGLKKLFVSEGVWQMLTSFASTVVYTVLFCIIAMGVSNGEYQVGDFTVYGNALSGIVSGVASLISIFASIYEGTLFIDNLIVFMERKKTVAPVLSEPRKLERHIAHTFELVDVSFRYPGSDHDVIKHISLKINAGETVVLVGLNGAGKTTLIKLLTRLYDPTEGVILLDGYDIREYSTEDVYAAFGIIFQDFGKYAVTVTENITFGQINRPFDMADVVSAAKHSNSTEFIERMPLKYDTPLMKYFEPTGIEPSIGQWQKLSIARAFYSDTDVLILDEPTASLDAIAEQEIYRQFDELRKDRTTLFVSHRLSSATTADKIFVLEGGCLVEEGSHSELMKLRGKYYELFSAQAERYITSSEEVRGFPPPPPEGFGKPPMGFEMPRDGMPPKGMPPFDGKMPPHGFPPRDGKPPMKEDNQQWKK